MSRAADLREAFDRPFARIQSVAATDDERLLGIEIGGERYLLRLTEISGLFTDKKITWLPSPVPELRGVAAVRGTLLPVYDLAMLLGSPRASAPRWLVVMSAAAVGLAFESFTGSVNVPPEVIAPGLPDAARGRHLQEFLRTDTARPVVHLPSLLETIEVRSRRHRPA